MSLLSACDLNDLAAVAEQAMGDTASVSRPVLTLDGSGGYTHTYAYAFTTPINLSRATGNTQQVIGGEQGEVSNQIIGRTPLRTPLLVQDRLTVGAQRFEVVGVLPDVTYATSHAYALVVTA